MPHLNSTIEAIAIKPLAQPDNYGNTFRVGMKFGEDWYSYGTIKKDQLDVKVGQEWVTVTKGMEVEFMYKVNGDFKNVDKKSFTITNQEGGVAPRPSQQAPQQGAPASRGSNVNPAEVGQCLNLAVECLGFTEADCVNPDKVVVAIQWYKRTRQLFSSLYPTVDLEEELPKEKPKPVAKKKPVVVEEDIYDDLEI